MLTIKGPFNNYVDKMSGEGGQKMSVFVHAQGKKTVQAGAQCFQMVVKVAVQSKLQLKI